MWNAHSKVRQFWFRLWAAVALLILTWSAGDQLAERFFSGAAAATLEATQQAGAPQAPGAGGLAASAEAR